jgi:hypothetical protein
MKAGFDFFCFGWLFIDFFYKNKTHLIFFFVKQQFSTFFLKKKIHKNAQKYHFIMTMSNFLPHFSTFWSFIIFLKKHQKKHSVKFFH